MRKKNSIRIEIYTEREFERQLRKLAKKYRSIIKDYGKFLDELEANPYQGSDLGNGIRKVRMAIASKGKGKSGGARVITYHLVQQQDTLVIDLLTIYDKGEMSCISDEFIQYLLERRTQV